MPEPTTLLIGGTIFLLQQATSATVKLLTGSDDGATGKLLEAAAGNGYYDLLKIGSGKLLGTAWRVAAERLATQTDENGKPLNHDLLKAFRRAQLNATLSACESCLEDLIAEEQSAKEGKNRIRRWFEFLSEDDDRKKSLIKIVNFLNERLKEIDKSSYIPDQIVGYENIIDIARPDYPLTTETAKTLVTDLQEDTIKEIRFWYLLNLGEPKIANLLEKKIREGWLVESKTGREPVPMNWFKLLCAFFSEEYKTNPRVEAALSKLLFYDLKGEIAHQAQNFTNQHLEEITQEIRDVLFELQTNIVEIRKEIANFTEIVTFFHEENVKLHLKTHDKLERLIQLVEMLLSRKADLSGEVPQQIARLHAELKEQQQSKTIEVLNLPNLNVEVYDRVEETAAVLQAICDDRERFHLVVAPSGFGKTYLLTKVLQEITDGALILPAYQTKVQRIIRFDCGSTRTISKIVSDFADLLGVRLDYNPQEGEKPAEWINKHLFGALKDIGTIWLVLENFESWLDSKRNYAVAEAEPRAFLNALFEGNHNLRALVLSQSEPEDHFNARLHKLTDVKQKLKEGLPKADALDYLRTKGAEAGLDRADEALLVRFLEDVCYIPQAVSSLVNYLTAPKIKTLWAAKNISFAKFMNDDELWAKFDAYEHDRDEQRPEIRRTKALIAAQIKAQSEDLQRLLRAMAFFNRKVPYEALEALFDDEEQAAEAIARLFEHGLATVTEDLRRTRYYELHAYFREQARKSEVLPLFEDFSDQTLENYAAKLLYEKGNEAFYNNYFRRAIDLYGCAGQIYGFLFAKKGRADLENHLATAFNGKGLSLWQLGKLTEAVIEYDKAIEIYRRLVEEENRDKLANNLAMALMNKGAALRQLGKLKEAIVEYDKAIEIYRRLVEEENRDELANDFATALMNKGIALANLDKLTEAIGEFNKAISIRRQLVEEENRDKLANDLAMALMNKGIALRQLGKAAEAVIEYDKAISIRRRLVEEENRNELAKDLAMALMNKGIALANLSKLTEAIDEFNKAVEIYRRLVEEENRDELAKDLAMALMNKGIALANLDKLTEAVFEFDNSERVRETCLQRGEFHVLPDFVKNIRNRIEELIKLEDWGRAANDAINALELALPLFERDDFSDHFKQQIGEQIGVILHLLRQVPPDNREKIYAAAGEAGGALRQFVESNQ
ncbi:MAG TPA: tetratricopeptide repeat protein [Pyrinomonadaceae bacterium]|jgi:tetratricopeptide (TPR) repeat protein